MLLAFQLVPSPDQGNRHSCPTAAHGTATTIERRTSSVQRVAGVALDHLRSAA
jgi:hypothetical protein